MVVCSRAGGLGQKQARASGTGAGTGTGDQLAELPIVVVLGAAPRLSTGGPPTAGTVGVERPVGRRPKTGGLGDVTTPRSQDERGGSDQLAPQNYGGEAGRPVECPDLYSVAFRLYIPPGGVPSIDRPGRDRGRAGPQLGGGDQLARPWRRGRTVPVDLARTTARRGQRRGPTIPGRPVGSPTRGRAGGVRAQLD